MARVVADDCLEHVPNRFDLVLLAARRARELLAGDAPAIDVNGHGAPVAALKEIAAGAITRPEIKERLIRSLQRIQADESDDEPEEFSMMDEQAMLDAVRDSEVADDRELWR